VLCFSGQSFVLRKSFRYASEPAYKLDVIAMVCVRERETICGEIFAFEKGSDAGMAFANLLHASGRRGQVKDLVQTQSLMSTMQKFTKIKLFILLILLR